MARHTLGESVRKDNQHFPRWFELAISSVHIYGEMSRASESNRVHPVPWHLGLRPWGFGLGACRWCVAALEFRERPSSILPHCSVCFISSVPASGQMWRFWQRSTLPMDFGPWTHDLDPPPWGFGAWLAVAAWRADFLQTSALGRLHGCIEGSVWAPKIFCRAFSGAARTRN